MRVFISFLLMVWSTTIVAQSAETRRLLLEHIQQKSSSVKTKILDQFSDNCIYEDKCGHFAKRSINEFGLVKGFMLAIDRRLRCNSLTKNQTARFRFNAQGKIIDHWQEYRVKVD